MTGGEVVSLIPFDRSHGRLLAKWLAKPHVARWYPRARADLAWALAPPAYDANALIACDGRPVGYLRWRKVSRETLDSLGLFQIPVGSVDIDILIGEPVYCGRGVGPRAISALVERLREDKSIPLVGLTPSVDNIVARRAYERANFRALLDYDPPGFGPCVLMILPFDRRGA